MNYDEAVEYIHGLLKFGSRPGLDRIEKLLTLMGNPQDKLKFIHVAGTNGKGSVVTFCAEIMKNAGYKTGLFISPYVIDFRERFQIDGNFISENELAGIFSDIRPHIEYLNSIDVIITEFEAVTAIAFEYFYRKDCEIVCLETGLGGTYDSTNIIKSSEVSVITSISRDHLNVLGNTISEIAAHKAGIIKKLGKTVCYPNMNDEALAVIMQMISSKKAGLIMPNPGGIEIISANINGNRFKYDGEEWETSLIGKHQIFNAVTAIEAVRNCGLTVPPEAVKRGLKEAILPARFEIIAKNPYVILDGSHNADGASVLRDTLELFPKIKKTAIIGVMSDKDIRGIISKLAPVCEHMIATDISGMRALDSVELHKIACEYSENSIRISNHEEALKKALELAGADGMVLVCGSFYLAGEIRKIKYFQKNTE